MGKGGWGFMIGRAGEGIVATATNAKPHEQFSSYRVQESGTRFE